MHSIYVEGPGDKKFVEDFIKLISLDNLISEVTPVGGWPGLRLLGPKLLERFDLGGKNLVVFDADSDKENKERWLDELENELNSELLDRDKGQFNIESQASLKFERFFFPNNHDEGELETLLLQCINQEHSHILDCFEAYKVCIANQNQYVLPDNKSKIYAYCQAILGKNKRNYLDKRLWNFDNFNAKPFKDFLLNSFVA